MRDGGRERERERETEREREGEREGVHYFGAEPLGLCRAKSVERTNMPMGYKGFKAKPIVRYWPIMVRQEL